MAMQSKTLLARDAGLLEFAARNGKVPVAAEVEVGGTAVSGSYIEQGQWFAGDGQKLGSVKFGSHGMDLVANNGQVAASVDRVGASGSTLAFDHPAHRTTGWAKRVNAHQGDDRPAVQFGSLASGGSISSAPISRAPTPSGTAVANAGSVSPSMAAQSGAAGSADPSTVAEEVVSNSGRKMAWIGGGVLALGALGLLGAVVVGAAVLAMGDGDGSTASGDAKSGAEGAAADGASADDGAAAASGASGGALAPVVARGKLIVGMDTGEPAGAGTPPMYVPDSSGKPGGFDYEIALAVAKGLGVPEVQIVHGKYSELPGMLVDKKQIDVIISGYTPTENPAIAWSAGYLDYGLCLVVGRNSRIKSVADLAGKAIGTFDDDAAAEAVNGLVKGYASLTRMEDGYWDALAAKKFEAFIYDYPYANAEISTWYEEHPAQKGAFQIVQYNMTEDHYSVGVRAADTDLLAGVNQALAAFQATDAYGELVKKYLSGGSKVEAPKSANVYIVVRGDSLSKIALQKLGSIDRWREIWSLNSERFPNPNLIEIGDQVVLP